MYTYLYILVKRILDGNFYSRYLIHNYKFLKQRRHENIGEILEQHQHKTI